MEINFEKIMYVLVICLTLISISVIYMFSSQEGYVSYEISGKVLYHIEKIGINISENMIRKIAHILIYFFLGVTTTTLTLTIIFKGKFLRYICGYIVSLLFCFICAILDELNQFYLDGRSGKFSDVKYDAIGFIIGASIVFVLILFCYFINKLNKMMKM